MVLAEKTAHTDAREERERNREGEREGEGEADGPVQKPVVALCGHPRVAKAAVTRFFRWGYHNDRKRESEVRDHRRWEDGMAERPSEVSGWPPWPSDSRSSVGGGTEVVGVGHF